MAPKKIQTFSGYSCSDCEQHQKKECPGCAKTKGLPFWTAYVGSNRCAIYDCCTSEMKFPHCGKCPDVVCERFIRFKNPAMGDAEAAAGVAAMEKELRGRK
ncbi:MAG: DUF3795 domain-containing protein [Methanoregula sp.]